MTDPEKSKAIERANSYRDMMNSWTWKDFQSVLDTIRKDALERTIWSSTLEDVQLQRGFVKCIDSINSSLGYILGEGQ